jgi:hypothetical protein
MEYIFIDDLNNNFDQMRNKKNVMVIYGQRVTDLHQQLNNTKDVISDFQFLLKSQSNKCIVNNNKQKYINVNSKLVQLKEKDLNEEIEKKKQQFKKEKEKENRIVYVTQLIRKDINETKKKEEKKKIEKKQENLLTSGESVISDDIIMNNNEYEPISNFDFNSYNVNENSITSSTKSTPIFSPISSAITSPISSAVSSPVFSSVRSIHFITDSFSFSRFHIQLPSCTIFYLYKCL